MGEEDEVGQDVPFMEAGIDSLASVQLVTDLSKNFSVALAPSVVFDFPTMRTLSEHLVTEVGGAAAPSSGGGDEWEDVEVPDDDYFGGDYEPTTAIVAVPQAAQVQE